MFIHFSDIYNNYSIYLKKVIYSTLFAHNMQHQNIMKEDKHI